MEKEIDEQKEKAAENTFDREQSLKWFWFIILFVLVFIIGPIVYIFTKRKYKAVLQKEYEVNPYVFNGWIKAFCPEEISQKYVGQKIKTIQASDVYSYLGKPGNCPQYSHNRKIISKDDLRRAYEISESTLRRDIKKAVNLEEQIGMSLQTYKDLHKFPPSKMVLICQYLEEKGRKRKV